MSSKIKDYFFNLLAPAELVSFEEQLFNDPELEEEYIFLKEELIENYFLDKLNEEDLDLFEKKMAEDKGFSKYVNLSKRVIDSNKREWQFEKLRKEVEETPSPDRRETKKPMVPKVVSLPQSNIRTLAINLASVAASILILILAFIIYRSPSTIDRLEYIDSLSVNICKKDLYKKCVEDDDCTCILTIMRDDCANPDKIQLNNPGEYLMFFNRILCLYKTENWNRVIKRGNQLIPNKLGNFKTDKQNRIVYYTTMAYLNLKQVQKAKEISAYLIKESKEYNEILARISALEAQ